MLILNVKKWLSSAKYCLLIAIFYNVCVPFLSFFEEPEASKNCLEVSKQPLSSEVKVLAGCRALEISRSKQSVCLECGSYTHCAYDGLECWSWYIGWSSYQLEK